jgi:tRNA(Ile)-lysidine synthase
MRRTDLTTAFRRALRDLGAPLAGETLIVGLSGGADSVALTDVAAQAAAERGFHVVAAHLDHGLRADSRDDAAFCSKICERLGLPLRTARTDVRARARRDGGGIEDAAREERYAFLRSVKHEVGASVIAVAHTRDDQAETFLMRLMRGAGSRGLAAMRPRSGDVIRPLLSVSREQVLDHLEGRGLPWREDPTNADPAFVRNRVRHELLPYLESHFNPRIRATLARCAGVLAEEADTLEGLAESLVAGALHRDGSIALPRRALAGAPRAVASAALRQVIASAGGLRAVSKHHVDSILSLVDARDGSRRRLPLPGGREAVVTRGEVAIGPRGSGATAPLLPATSHAEARP